MANKALDRSSGPRCDVLMYIARSLQKRCRRAERVYSRVELEHA